MRCTINEDEQPERAAKRSGLERRTIGEIGTHQQWRNAPRHPARLKREGLVAARRYGGVLLTDAGRALAARVRTRHRLLVEVLPSIRVPREAADADAAGIEHYVSETTLGAFDWFLRSRG